MPTLPFLTSAHPYELLSWVASCPAPFEAICTLILLQILFILLLTEGSKSSIFGSFPTPLNNGALMKQLNGDYKPSDYPSADGVSPKKLRLTPVSHGQTDGSPSPSRPTVQKLKHGQSFRNSVLKGNDNAAAILSSFSHLESYLKKKGSGLSGWQRRYFVVELAYLKYYSGEDYANDVPMAAIDIRQMSNIAISPEGPTTFGFDLQQGTSKRYTLRADTADLAVKWVKNLQQRRRALLDDDENEVGGGEGSSERYRSESSTITSKHTITEEETQRVRQLKEKFPDIESATLLRFLRAAKHNMQSTVDKIVDHIKWREDTFPINFDDIKEECGKGKYMLCGRDKEGSLVVYIQGDKLGAHTYTSIEHHMESVFYLLEVVCSEILEDPLEKFTIVYNRLHVEKKNRDFAWAENIGKTLANHYPERMKRAYVIPANMLFRTIWAIAKVFFDPDTASKIAFVSGAQSLKKFIDEDQLPRELGGTLDYQFDVNHLFTKKIPGVNSGSPNRNNGAPAQARYNLPSHFNA